MAFGTMLLGTLLAAAALRRGLVLISELLRGGGAPLSGYRRAPRPYLVETPVPRRPCPLFCARSLAGQAMRRWKRPRKSKVTFGWCRGLECCRRAAPGSGNENCLKQRQVNFRSALIVRPPRSRILWKRRSVWHRQTREIRWGCARTKAAMVDFVGRRPVRAGWRPLRYRRLVSAAPPARPTLLSRAELVKLILNFPQLRA